mgnify:CR=1 FL=1
MGALLLLYGNTIVEQRGLNHVEKCSVSIITSEELTAEKLASVYFALTDDVEKRR